MALASKPKVLLLDEPLAGMGPEESERMVVLLQSLAREHAVLLIEHDMDFVFKVADRMTVIVEGAVLAENPGGVAPIPPCRRPIWEDTHDGRLPAPILEVKDLHTFYDQSHILRGVSLALAPGETIGLMGRNGMGKTTLIRTIMGLVRASGSIVIAGQDMTHAPAFRIAQRGIAYVPEGRGIFGSLWCARTWRSLNAQASTGHGWTAIVCSNYFRGLPSASIMAATNYPEVNSRCSR